ncbi:virulence factor Mce-like protein [Mycobacterium sp. MAA66]|uniref:MCE family protein n=1 Tax=Mycobacterium sp. MAA66 TaxID=3156297 RepID=UPI0035153E09
MTTTRHLTYRPLGGFLAAASVTLLSGCGVGLESVPLPAGGPGEHTITVNAVFANALNLPTKAKVKLNGADIGEVSSITARDFTAFVQMRVDSDVPLFLGSTAQLRSATPLGDIFVAINPNPNQAPTATRLHDGDTIPLASTSTAATIEEVLSSGAVLVNGGSIRQLVTIVNGTGKAVGGKGANIATLLQQSNDILSHLNSRSQELQTALRTTSELATTLTARQNTINEALVAASPAVAAVTENTTKITDLTDAVGRITGQLSRFPSLQGTDTRSLVADMNRISDAFTQVGTDPNATMVPLNQLIPIFLRSAHSTATTANANLVQLAFGNHPDKNYPGDPASHGPDGTDYHSMVGSLRYEWNLLLDKIYGPNR